jgi:hypothetical protein
MTLSFTQKALVAGGVIVVGYLAYSHFSSPAQAAPSPGILKSGRSGDQAFQDSGGLVHTLQAQTILKGTGAVWLSNDLGDPTMAGHIADDNALIALALDGGWGPLTSHAVSVYQARKGLPASGRVDANTARALLAESH